MALEKRGSSSSEESDQQSTKRSYECTFCKRGFTNAQALGGHMNIHRKDRAKAKILTTTRPSMSSEQGKYYPARRACFEAPGPGPSYCATDHFVGAASLRMNEELWGANLRLGIGPAEDLMKMRCMRKEDEIDLELRLGHHP